MTLLAPYHLFGSASDRWSLQVYNNTPLTDQDDTITVAAGGNANIQRGICWGDGGTKLYAASRGDDIVRQVNLTSAYDLSAGLTYHGASFVGLATGNSHGIWFRDDGLQFYVFRRTEIISYNLTSAWDITAVTDSVIATVDVTAPGISRGHGISFSPNGQYLYIDCRRDLPTDDPAGLYQWEMSTPWDLTTLSFTAKYTFLENIHNATRNNHISPDGKRILALAVGSRWLWEYELSTPWMVATAKPVVGIDMSELPGSLTQPYGFVMVPDGTSVVTSLETGELTQIGLTPRAATDPVGTLSTSAIWKYDTSLGAGLTVTIALREQRAADYHVVDWGDGTSAETLAIGSGSLQTYSHTYSTGGIYTVTLTGGAGGLVIAYDTATRDMLTEVVNWGTGMGWTNFNDICRLCPNITALPSNWPISVRKAGTATTGNSDRGAFEGAAIGSLTVIRDWDLRSLTQAQEMFNDVGTIGGAVSWKMPTLREPREMLHNTTFNQRLDDLDLGQAGDVRSMLAGTTFDNDSPANWDWSSVTNAAGLFPTLSTANYDAILIAIADHGAALQSGVLFGASSSTYSAGAAADARTVLTGTYSWSITDGGQA